MTLFQQIPSYCRLLLIAFSFLGMLFSVWRSRHRLRAEFRLVPAVYLWGLALLILVPVVFYAWFIIPKHIIDDEAFYQLTAKNILRSGNLGNLPKSGGWAFLISLGYLFTGINNYVSIQISQFLGAGSIIGIFFLALWAGLSLRTAFIGAALFTFVPARMFWAATGESHTASIFFVIWAAAFSFLLYRNSDRNIFWLVISVWVFAALIRCETIFIFLFFLICTRLFVPKHICKELPFFDALCWGAIILTPQIILGIGHVLGGHWAVTGPNISAGNFLHNTASYGVDFLIGRVHPVLLTLSAVLGATVIYRRDKRVALVLAGWLVLLSLTYFSMWFANYGNSPGMFLKTKLFIFFYPPLILCAACGLVWLADKYTRPYKALAAAILCGAIILWSFLYYRDYPTGQDKFTLEMRLVDQIGRTITPHDMAVTCYPETFTSPSPSFEATDTDWFLQQPLWRAAAFEKARKVYLIEDIVSQRECQDTDSLIKKKGKAVLAKQWTQGDARYAVYSLSRF